MKIFFKSRLLKILTLSVLFLFTFSSVGFASATTKFDYVALGDSLAVGWTPDNTIDKGYTDIIAEKLAGEGVLGNFDNFGYPSYTTTNVLGIINPMNPENAGRIAAISKAEIITLDIGANDLISVLLTTPSQVPAAMQGTVLNISKIIGTLKALNPKAKIYLMGYYNAFPYLPEQQQELLNGVIIQFNQFLKELAKATGVTYVDTYAAMDKHLDKSIPEANIHPSVFGYREIAQEFWSIIKVDFLRGLN